MPQNTPMKRQFTTIDSRTVMSNLPQHWGGNDWTITGVDNPLPVGNYVQTEAGVWIPQKGSDDGAADVRLTGSNVLLLKSEEDNNLFNELSNRGFAYLGENVSVSTAGIQPFSLKNSGKRSVLIKNNTDVEIKISGWHIFSDSKHLGVIPTDIRVASGATAFVSSEVEVLSYPAIRAAMTIVGRPTEGSLSIYVFGR